MSPYMRAYEAGIKLAQTEFFDKVAAPAGKGYPNPKPKGPQDPKAKDNYAPPKGRAPTKMKKMKREVTNEKVAERPGDQLKPTSGDTGMDRDMKGGALTKKPAPTKTAPTKTAPSRPAPSVSMPDFKSFSLPSMGKSKAIQGGFGEEETRAPRAEAPRRRDPVMDTPDRAADRSPVLPSKRETATPDFADTNRYVPAERAPEPSFLQNVMNRVGDATSGAKDYFSSPQALRDFEDSQYGTSDAMDDAEFDSMNNAAMDVSNQETAAKLEDIPGTPEYEARMEQEEADAIANRFDVQKGGYGRQLRRFREQFGQDDANRELLEGINYKDFASALGNRGLRVGDQIDARDILNRLRTAAGAEGPVDTNNLDAIGIRDSRGRDASRGALGRGRRPTRAAKPRQSTVEQPNITDESPALPSGTSDITPTERGRLYGELDSLYDHRKNIVREAGGRPLTPEQKAEVSKMNKAIQGYVGMDKELLPMYNREGAKFRRMREAQRERFGDTNTTRSNSDGSDARRLLSSLGSPSAPIGNAELLARLQQQGR